MRNPGKINLKIFFELKKQTNCENISDLSIKGNEQKSINSEKKTPRFQLN